MTNPPIFDVYENNELFESHWDLPTMDLREAQEAYRASLGCVYNELGIANLREVELRVSVQKDEWHTVRRGWSYNGDWFWYVWEGGNTIQAHVGLAWELPLTTLAFEPTGQALTIDEFIAACVLFEIENEGLIELCWGDDDERAAWREQWRY